MVSASRPAPDPRISETLRRYRRQKRLTVKELARRAGVWPSSLYMMEGSTKPAPGRTEPRPPIRGLGVKTLRQLRPVLGEDFYDEMIGILSDPPE